ncbi:MAG: amidophosphoribosyltransferase [Victivallaceae bacterium]|nr:hypothetical protein [Victivallaceae bacterium]
MSDSIKHECGIALLRLLKPLDFYRRKYGTLFYGFERLSLLMEKQHNRGQDGAGVACVALDNPPGVPYFYRERSNSATPLKSLFDRINAGAAEFAEHNRDRLDDTAFVKANARFCGELYLGHLRYGTFGKNDLEACHPFVRESTCIGRTLIMAGNFNLTNVKSLFEQLAASGHHLVRFNDGTVMLHLIGHYLEQEMNMMQRTLANGAAANREIIERAAAELDLGRVLRNGCANWDGGFVVSGMTGAGDAFVIRDSHGIRPCYYYCDDEIAVAASERPPIQTAFNAPFNAIRELPRGNALIIRKNGEVKVEECITPAAPAECSFERIYFSRGNDAEIYSERKNLGRSLVPAVLDAVDHDLENTVFSYIPNTAETGFLGLREGVWDYCRERQFELLKKLKPGDDEGMRRILSMAVRSDKIAVKDAKLRTFIADSLNRHALIGHVYDTTGGVVRPGVDNLVVLDDSIVRGATLRDSILRMLDRLRPRRVVVVSTAPPICYPDCYGIDMASLGEFVAFEAAVRLLRRRDRAELLNEVFAEAQQQLLLPDVKQVNVVKNIYAPLTQDDLADEIAEILRPSDMHADLKVIYQTLDDLSRCCPKNPGNWYFSGDYPTPGGNRVVNQAFVNYMTGVTGRAY